MKNLFINKKNRIVFISLNIFFVLIYFIIKNINESLYIIKIPLFSFKEKFFLFFLTLFKLNELNNLFLFFLIFLFILSISFFVLLLINLYKENKKIQNNKKILPLLSIIISIIGMSCFTCGIGLLVSILSFFGVSSLILLFPFNGIEIGFLGLILLNISNYLLLKKLKNPFTC